MNINVLLELETGFNRAPVKVLIIPMGDANPGELSFLPPGLSQVFKPASFKISEEAFRMPAHAYDKARRQYNSTLLLEYLAVSKPGGYSKYLGVTEADLYAGKLNFVFGEAILNGEDAIVSLHRLRPEFYGKPPDKRLFEARVLKEAVHELGHTFGLTHCTNPECVMRFSNSIIDTDFKKAQPCLNCQVKLFRRIVRNP
ncbi:MAG: archaemetzincin family Zn-dependent metalloprotease [Thermoproteota archaeon]